MAGRPGEQGRPTPPGPTARRHQPQRGASGSVQLQRSNGDAPARCRTAHRAEPRGGGRRAGRRRQCGDNLRHPPRMTSLLDHRDRADSRDAPTPSQPRHSRSAPSTTLRRVGHPQRRRRGAGHVRRASRRRDPPPRSADVARSRRGTRAHSRPVEEPTDGDAVDRAGAGHGCQIARRPRTDRGAAGEGHGDRALPAASGVDRHHRQLVPRTPAASRRAVRADCHALAHRRARHGYEQGVPRRVSRGRHRDRERANPAAVHQLDCHWASELLWALVVADGPAASDPHAADAEEPRDDGERSVRRWRDEDGSGPPDRMWCAQVRPRPARMRRWPAARRAGQQGALGARTHRTIAPR